MRTNINNFILEAINFKSYDLEKLKLYLKNIEDVELFRKTIIHNRIGGIVFDVLNKTGLISQIDNETKKVLSDVYDSNKRANEDLQIVLMDISQTLSSHSYKYAMLKGAFLIPCLYEKGLRVSNDIDILLSQKDIDQIDTDLVKNGFSQKVYREGVGWVEPTRKEKLFARMNYGELVPYFKDFQLEGIRTAIIDVNISLDFQAKYNTNLVDVMLENVNHYKVDKEANLFTLCPTDFIIHLCAHLFKEATIYDWVKENRDTHLYKYCDIYAYLLQYSNNDFIKELGSTIVEYRLEKECYYTFVNSIKLFPILEKNQALKQMINEIKPNNIDFMKHVYWPMERKLYEYDNDFLDWVFCTDKIQYLKELTYEQS